MHSLENVIGRPWQVKQWTKEGKAEGHAQGYYRKELGKHERWKEGEVSGTGAGGRA